MTKSSPSIPTQTTVTCGPPVELSVVIWAKGAFAISSRIDSGIFIIFLRQKLCGDVPCRCPHCHPPDTLSQPAFLHLRGWTHRSCRRHLRRLQKRSHELSPPGLRDA